MSTSKQQTISRISHWFSSDVCGVDVSTQIVSRLVKAGRVSSIGGFYHLKPEDFQNLKKVKPAMASDILTALANNTTIPLDRVIYGLLIPGVEEREAKILAQQFDDFDDFCTRAFDPLDTYAFGQCFADKAILIEIEDWYQTYGREMLEEIKELTLVPDTPLKIVSMARSVFDGKKVYLRGRFMGTRQQEIAEQIEDRGGEIVDEWLQADIVMLGIGHGIDIDAIVEYSPTIEIVEVNSNPMAEEILSKL